MTAKRKGFTLIELLVVMTIISLLLGISLVAYSSSRKGARDSKRKADLEQIRSALEIYRSDNGGYPKASYSPAGGLVCQTNSYVGSMSDPVTGSSYAYRPGSTTTTGCGGGANSGVTTYSVCAHLESPSSTDPLPAGCAGNYCGTLGNCNYGVTNP